MRIGFVGTGTMETPIAGCLIRTGHSLSVYDRRPEASAALCAQGAVRADSGFAAARDSEVVVTSLPGPAEFEAAMLEPQTGILAGLRPGAAHIDLTTNAPKTVARVGEACRSRGVELLDAPVSGRPPAMTVMIGASDASFAKYRPLFEAIAANIFHVGPSGAGATAKLVTQYLGYTNFIASIEGMLVAAKAGIDLDILARIVPVSAGQSRTFDNIARGVFPGTFAAGGLACTFSQAKAHKRECVTRHATSRKTEPIRCRWSVENHCESCSGTPEVRGRRGPIVIARHAASTPGGEQSSGVPSSAVIGRACCFRYSKARRCGPDNPGNAGDRGISKRHGAGRK